LYDSNNPETGTALGGGKRSRAVLKPNQFGRLGHSVIVKQGYERELTTFRNKAEYVVAILSKPAQMQR
jgi:hypothetical protein